jgi:hypothetical protein
MRRTYAALLCFVWLLGIEVLPNAHLLSHADGEAHEHAANGTVITVSFDADTHSHDGVTHSHGEVAKQDAKKKRARDILAIDRVPDLHVASGLAHRAVALHEAPAPVVDAIAVDRVVTELVAAATGRVTIALVTTADARGPPSRQS